MQGESDSKAGGSEGGVVVVFTTTPRNHTKYDMPELFARLWQFDIAY